jgi:hypothetical protein
MSHAPHLTEERQDAIFNRLCDALIGEQTGDVMPALARICGWSISSAEPMPPLTREEATQSFFDSIRAAADEYSKEEG